MSGGWSRACCPTCEAEMVYDKKRNLYRCCTAWCQRVIGAEDMARFDRDPTPIRTLERALEGLDLKVEK